jgi:thiol-disulfide isomerase/thioredoxin
MKKFIPILLFIMAFTGFLSTQILWDNFYLNAEIGEQDKQKHSVYETNFQSLILTTSRQRQVELRIQTAPIVVLNFWASWCQPCLREFPSLVEFQEKYKGRVLVIGINGDEEKPEEKVRKTEAKYKLNFESALDPKSALANKFMISTYPVSIIFHRGKVIYVSKKIHDFMNADFLSIIDSALKSN